MLASKTRTQSLLVWVGGRRADVMQVLGLCPGGCVVRADWKEVAERCAEDEKALVRKAAVQVVAQVALATGELARTDADVVSPSLSIPTPHPQPVC